MLRFPGASSRSSHLPKLLTSPVTLGAVCLLGLGWPRAMAAPDFSIISSADASRVTCTFPSSGDAYALGCGMVNEDTFQVDFIVEVFGLDSSEIASVAIYAGSEGICGSFVDDLDLVPSDTPNATYDGSIATGKFPLGIEFIAEGEVYFIVQPSTAFEPSLRGQLKIPGSSKPGAGVTAADSEVDAYFALNPDLDLFEYDVAIIEPAFTGAPGQGAFAEIFNGNPQQGGQPLFPLLPFGPEGTRWKGSFQGFTTAQKIDYSAGRWWLRITSSNGAVDDRPLDPGTLYGWPQFIDTQFGGSQGLWIDAGPEFAGGLYFILGTTSGTSPSLLLPDGLGGILGGPLGFPLVFDEYLDLTLSAPTAGAITTPIGVLDRNGRASTAFQLPAGFPDLNFPITVHHSVVLFDPQTGFIADFSNPHPCVILP